MILRMWWITWFVLCSAVDHNNWVVLINTSRYWYNYRHVANTLSFYHTVKRLGVPDSQIILMLAEDVACNARNTMPGTVFNNKNHQTNLYGEHVEVDYRGDEVTTANFLRLFTGRHDAMVPRNKRLMTDENSNIFVFMAGHSGPEFVKIQDFEEVTSTDLANVFAEMKTQRRFKEIFWIADTCQAASLQNSFYTPGILGLGSSTATESSYSHHIDREIGIAVIDRFTFFSLEFFRSLTPTSKRTVKDWMDNFEGQPLMSTPTLRTDLFGRPADKVLLTDFMAASTEFTFRDEFVKALPGAEPEQCLVPPVFKPLAPRPSATADYLSWVVAAFSASSHDATTSTIGPPHPGLDQTAAISCVALLVGFSFGGSILF